jgi:hypothetical protein
MNSKFKRALSALVSFTLVLSMSITALAATSYTWGPSWFTPYDGIASVTSTKFRGGALKWSQTSIDQYGNGDYWELEARNSNIENVWGSSTGSVSNMPNFYIEVVDDDDRSIGCSHVKNLVADTSYYGEINFTASNTYGGKIIGIESEYGWWLIGDGLPYGYEQNPLSLTTNAGYTSSVGW